jgi:replicative DNA helicase
MGKTSFVLNMAVNVASPKTIGGRQDPGYGVVFFSLEMPTEQLTARGACSEGRVDLLRARQGFLQPDDWTRLHEAAAYLSTLPIWFDDTPAIDLMRIRSVVRRHQAEYDRPATDESPARKIGLVVIDYLQLMKGSGRANNREQDISEITRGLKEIAKELRVAIVVLSQLNRAVELRAKNDRRPQLSDLRESGAIEQDADTIIFIYRDEYYNAETTNAKGIAELIIAKQRSGPIGKVLVRFAASYTRFDNLTPSEYPQDLGDE